MTPAQQREQEQRVEAIRFREAVREEYDRVVRARARDILDRWLDERTRLFGMATITPADRAEAEEMARGGVVRKVVDALRLLCWGIPSSR